MSYCFGKQYFHLITKIYTIHYKIKTKYLKVINFKDDRCSNIFIYTICHKVTNVSKNANLTITLIFQLRVKAALN